MITRVLIGVAAAATVAGTALAGPVSPAQADNFPYPGVGNCLNWQAEGNRDYCKIRPSDAHVNIPNFVNSSDREVAYLSLSGSGRNWERSGVLRPGRGLNIWGSVNAGVDVWLEVSWCPTKTYTANCSGKLSANLEWMNPTIGWPWMSVDKAKHGFRSMEAHTFEMAFGHAGAKGVAKFKAVRLTDMSSGTKRFDVDFTFASR